MSGILGVNLSRSHSASERHHADERTVTIFSELTNWLLEIGLNLNTQYNIHVTYIVQSIVFTAEPHILGLWNLVNEFNDAGRT